MKTWLSSGQKIYTSVVQAKQLIQPGIPSVPTEPVAFPQRIGEKGVELNDFKFIKLSTEPKMTGPGLNN